MYTFLPKKCDYNAFVEPCVGVYLSLSISLSPSLSQGLQDLMWRSSSSSLSSLACTHHQHHILSIPYLVYHVFSFSASSLSSSFSSKSSGSPSSTSFQDLPAPSSSTIEDHIKFRRVGRSHRNCERCDVAGRGRWGHGGVKLQLPAEDGWGNSQGSPKILALFPYKVNTCEHCIHLNPDIHVFHQLHGLHRGSFRWKWSLRSILLFPPTILSHMFIYVHILS